MNTDPKERARQTIQREQMTWPTFWDGGNTGGPIARMWANVAWPTFNVIDAKGVIRYRSVHGEELEQAVDKLLAEMGKSAKN